MRSTDPTQLSSVALTSYYTIFIPVNSNSTPHFTISNYTLPISFYHVGVRLILYTYFPIFLNSKSSVQFTPTTMREILFVSQKHKREHDENI
jgi:hypothetical protein